ncbi:MAG: sugar kinase [Planctomycetales bacterium]|nr:sugar kinase [Planctomycetales bacterium]MCA9163815.1 sugar kinase [Planctomycetales bacterium]MCA9208214.1 sugar kinase [Planctomycetales bacterium]
MARIAPPRRLRWRQALPGSVEVTWGGGEANVCASLAMLGKPVRYFTSLPRHALAESLVTSLRGLGVETRHIYYRDTGRLGLYFVETGANQRGSTVLYDREHSAISLAEPAEYDFDSALSGVHWLHLSGITPAISEAAYRSNLELARHAKRAGVTISCDLNFRKKLWNWRPGVKNKELARQCMTELLPLVDLVIANEADAEDVLGIQASDTNVEHGELNVAAYESVAREIVRQFPNVTRVAITLRESLSADHNNWGAMLFETATDQAYFAPLDAHGQYQPYEIRDIVDRVGAGDSFAAGLLYALDTNGLDTPSRAIQFAVAASCLKHSIEGDFNYVTREEIESLMSGNASGRVQR